MPFGKVQLLCEGFDPDLTLDLAYVRNESKVCLLSGSKEMLESVANAEGYQLVESLADVGVVAPVNEADQENDEAWRVDPNAEFVVEGPFQRWGVRNANKRVYPKELFHSLVGESGSYVNTMLKERRMAGHLEHPGDGRTKLNEIGIVTTHLTLHPNKADNGATGIVRGRAVIPGTRSGRELRELSKVGYRWGVSSRGRGAVDERGNVKWSGKNESDDFQLQTFDAVADPSTPGAIPSPVRENTPAAPTNEAEGSGNPEKLANYIATEMKSEYLSSVVRPVRLWKKQGKYDESQAPNLPKNIVLAGAKKMAGSGWETAYPPDVRERVQRLVLARAVKDAESGAVDDTLPKKYQKGGDASESVTPVKAKVRLQSPWYDAGQKVSEDATPEDVLFQVTKQNGWAKNEDGSYTTKTLPGVRAELEGAIAIRFVRTGVGESVCESLGIAEGAVKNDTLSIRVPLADYALGESLDEAAMRGEAKVWSKRDDGDPMEPLARRYVQYIKNGNSYTPAGEVDLKENLGRHAYRISVGMGGPTFTKVKMKTDELYHLEGSVTERVLKEIDRFWSMKESYDKLNLRHARGILLFGPPGCSKSSTINQVVEQIVERGDVVFYTKSVHDIAPCLKAFREVEPDRKVVMVLEDADGYINYSERELLNLMDGEEMFESVLWLATTNYIDRFPPRLLRPGRFDKKIKVPPPTMEARVTYLHKKLGKLFGVTEKECRDVAKELDGLSFGHLKEYIASVYAMGEPKREVLDRLKGEKSLVESADAAADNFAPADAIDESAVGVLDESTVDEDGGTDFKPGQVVVLRPRDTGSFGTRRYVIASKSNTTGQYDLVALSGATAGSNPTGVGAANMQLAKDQSKAFVGKERQKLKRTYGSMQQHGKYFKHDVATDDIPVSTDEAATAVTKDVRVYYDRSRSVLGAKRWLTPNVEGVEYEGLTPDVDDNSVSVTIVADSESTLDDELSYLRKSRQVRKVVLEAKTGVDEVHVGFKNLVNKFRARGVKNPGGLARYIGIKKYGLKRFHAMTRAGMASHGHATGESAVDEITHDYYSETDGNRRTIHRSGTDEKVGHVETEKDRETGQTVHHAFSRRGTYLSSHGKPEAAASAVTKHYEMVSNHLRQTGESFARWREVSPGRFRHLAEAIGFTDSVNHYKETGRVKFVGQGDSTDNLVAFRLTTPKGTFHFVAENESDYAVESVEFEDGSVLEGADLNERGIARLYRHVDGNSRGYAILSADRHERSEAENATHRKALEHHLRKIGKGFHHVVGGYVETGPDGKQKTVREHSYFVPNVSRREARHLAKHAYQAHGQEAILHGHGKYGSHLIFHNGKREKVGDQASMHHATQYFTQYKRRKFGMGAKVRPMAASVGNESTGDMAIEEGYFAPDHAAYRKPEAFRKHFGKLSAAEHLDHATHHRQAAKTANAAYTRTVRTRSGRADGMRRASFYKDAKPEGLAHTQHMAAARQHEKVAAALQKSGRANLDETEIDIPEGVAVEMNVLSNGVATPDRLEAAVEALREHLKGERAPEALKRRITEALAAYARERLADTAGLDELRMGILGRHAGPFKPKRHLVNGHAPAPKGVFGKIARKLKLRYPGESVIDELNAGGAVDYGAMRDDLDAMRKAGGKAADVARQCKRMLDTGNAKHAAPLFRKLADLCPDHADACNAHADAIEDKLGRASEAIDGLSIEDQLAELESALATIAQERDETRERNEELRSKLDTAESALVQLATTSDEDDMHESASDGQATAGVSESADGRQSDDRQQQLGRRLLPGIVTESAPLNPERHATRPADETSATVGIFRRAVQARRG